MFLCFYISSSLKISSFIGDNSVYSVFIFPKGTVILSDSNVVFPSLVTILLISYVKVILLVSKLIVADL